MKKKLLVLSLCMLLMSAVFVGCGSNNNEVVVNDVSTQNANNTVTETTETEATEVAVDTNVEVEKNNVFASPEWVKNVIDGNEEASSDYVIIEASWGEANINETYKATHIPGAVHMNTDEIEEPMYWNIRTGEEITAVMAKYGITKDTTVIVYGGDSGAARVAFVCLWAGVEDVKLLDGGLNAWLASEYPTEEGIVEPTATTEAFGIEIPAHPEYVLAMPEDAQAAMDNNENFKLVSIRSLEEFKGEISGYSYIERAGEPAGAVWGQDEFSYLNEDGTFVDIELAESILNEQGITKDNDIAFYCGTGWRATIPFLIAYENGWENIQLFDGGWFVWQMDENNPVQYLSPEEAAEQ